MNPSHILFPFKIYHYLSNLISSFVLMQSILMPDRAAVMEGAFLLIATNETCSQLQTSGQNILSSRILSAAPSQNAYCPLLSIRICTYVVSAMPRFRSALLCYALLCRCCCYAVPCFALLSRAVLFCFALLCITVPCNSQWPETARPHRYTVKTKSTCAAYSVQPVY